MRLPVGMMERILEYRHYAAHKAIYDGATTPKARQALRAREIFRLIEQVTFALVQEARAAKRAAG